VQAPASVPPALPLPLVMTAELRLLPVPAPLRLLTPLSRGLHSLT